MSLPDDRSGDLPSRSDKKHERLYLCRANGEGQHSFRICADEAAVMVFYQEMFGLDMDGKLDGAIEHFRDSDNWSNGGEAYHCELYCATFEVWKVTPSEMSRAPSSTSSSERVPICGTKGTATVSRAIWDEAWLAYEKKYSGGEAQHKRLLREGFYAEELDMFRPGWRPVDQRIAALERELAEANTGKVTLTNMLAEEMAAGIAPSATATASAKMLDAVRVIEANRQELIQNGTCAYLSPRPNGLWVAWHYAKDLCDLVLGTTLERGRFTCTVCDSYGPTKAFESYCDRKDCPKLRERSDIQGQQR